MYRCRFVLRPAVFTLCFNGQHSEVIREAVNLQIAIREAVQVIGQWSGNLNIIGGGVTLTRKLGVTKGPWSSDIGGGVLS